MAPKNTDLASLSLDKLHAMRDEIDALIKQKTAEAREELRNKFAAEASRLGFDPKEIFAKAKKPVAVKYQDSEGNTWTGRGHRPKVWANMTDKDLEKLLVK